MNGLTQIPITGSSPSPFEFRISTRATRCASFDFRFSNLFRISNFGFRVSNPLILSALALFLSSCAATSVKSTWKSPGAQPPAGKIAVLAIEERGFIRQGFENYFVAGLEKAGAPAVATFSELNLSNIKQDKQATAERLRSLGAEALLILRLVDVASFYRESQPGGPRYVSTVTGFNSMGWYDYYSVGFTDLNPTYGNLKQKMYLETALYDLKTEKRLWSGLTQTIVTEDMDRHAELTPLVQKIISAMQKDGVIR